MINVSNAFKQELYEGHRHYLEYADITLSDGTELNLTNADFWQGGMSLDDAVSGNDAFEIGAAIVNSCSLTIENLDDRFSEYDFLNAKVVIHIGLNLPNGTTERVRKGTYTVNDPKYNGATISLNCQDYMAKFDRPYSESTLTYPATLGSIVRDACSTCGVSLQTYDFPHSSFVIQTRPADEAITFREVISWAAQITGCFCRCDVQGRLELKWYNQQLLEKHGYDGGIFDKVSSAKYTTGDNVDGGTFNPWNAGDVADGGTFEEMEGIHHIYSHYSAPVISTDDVVITGVRVLEKAKEQDEETGSEKDVIITYQSGSDGYVVSIENNELIQGRAGLQISNWLSQQLIGFRFRKASLSHASDPTIEAGDIALVTDRKQNTYPIIISSTRFSTGSAQSTESSAETPARNSAARFSAQTKNYVEYRKDIEKERTEREKAQDELKERIDSSSGLYSTEETQPDGSKIFYMHDKPTLEESMIAWKMTAEAWGVSTDGGDTYNAGMTVDGDTIVRILTATGINADWIKTGAFEIVKDGKVMVLMDKDTGEVILRPDVFELSSGATIESIAEGKAKTAADGALNSAKGYTDTTAQSTLQSANGYADTAASDAVNDFVSKTYNPKIADLQKQLDGQIESYYYNYAPSLDNIPASNWATETDKQKHEGDLFYNRTTGYAYRFFKDSTAWKWQLIQDTDITKAIEQAAAAQDTADHKRRVFVSTPTVPYDVGDLWVQGDKGDILRCQTAKSTSQSYSANDWVKASKYTDDSALTAFIKGDFATLSAQADKKAETFYQVTDPSSGWSSDQKTEHIGDLWYNSTTTVQKYYRWDGKAWQELTSTPPDAVFDQIDGKAQIFIDTPKPPYHVGDLWFQSNTSDIMTCTKERLDGNYNSGDWQKRNKYISQSDANTAASNAVNDFVSKTYNPKIADLQKQLDGQIESYYYNYAPSLDNIPASNWATETDKQKHEGDLFYNRTTGYAYRFFKDSTAWKWQLIQDTDITKAIEQAAAAQDTADHKRRVFVSTPTVPYDVGDLWVQGDKGDILRCQTAKSTSQSYSANDWVKASKYTDDSALTAFIKGDFATLSAQADKKAETFYQVTDPSSGWSSDQKTEHIGDLWYNSTTTVQKYYRWDGKAWQELTSTPPDAVFDQIDGKAQIFIDTPKPPYHVGDLWFQSNTSDIMTCTKERLDGNYNSGDWQKRNKYISQSDANTAASNAVKAQTQEDIFNKLTDGGEIQGLFMRDGKIYVNASYILSGILALGGASNGNGTCVVRDASGNALVTLDNKGITLAPSVRIAFANISGTDNIATKDEIPENVSELENDSGYITKSAVPSKLSELANDAGFITSANIPSNDEIVELIKTNRGTIITKEYIGTLKVVAGAVDAGTVTGCTITGSTVRTNATNTYVELTGGRLNSYNNYSGYSGSFMGVYGKAPVVYDSHDTAWTSVVIDCGTAACVAGKEKVCLLVGSAESGFDGEVAAVFSDYNVAFYVPLTYVSGELAVDEDVTIAGDTTAKNMTLSGSITLPNAPYTDSNPVGLKFSGGATVYSTGAQHLYFQASTEENYAMQYGVVDNTWALAPGTTEKLQLGTASHRWNVIFARNSTVQTSDARQKNSIAPISVAYEQIFEQLRPVTYRINDGDRVHTGFISQDIEKTLNDVGLTAEDWGAFCKDTGEDGEDIYGMRYSEVIALNTHMIQKLMKRIDELEARIQELEGR